MEFHFIHRRNKELQMELNIIFFSKIPFTPHNVLHKAPKIPHGVAQIGYMMGFFVIWVTKIVPCLVPTLQDSLFREKRKTMSVWKVLDSQSPVPHPYPFGQNLPLAS